MESSDVEKPNSTEENPNTTQKTNGADSDADVVLLSSDDSDSETFANPEPPKELVEKHLLEADTIGGTVFSKHWLFTTLMKLIEAVDKEEQILSSSGDSDAGIDLDEALQDELCKLWDMSMNSEVVTFLMEFKAIDLLSGVISKSKAPRAIEICVGILGNMACSDTACLTMSNDQKIRSLVLLLLDSPDPPTLVETTRLLNICISSPSVCSQWADNIKQEQQKVFQSLTFILRSSTNIDLLTNVADVIDKVMDQDDDILVLWSNAELIGAVLEAVKQSSSRKEAVDTFLHILQLVSTCESGVESLGSHSDDLCQLTLQYLTQICSEDIVVIEGQEDTVGSALSVLATSFTVLDDKSKLLAKDFQMVRCLVKLLDVVYPKLRSFTPSARDKRSRTDSRCSVSERVQESTVDSSDATSTHRNSSSKEDSATDTAGDDKGSGLGTSDNCDVVEISAPGGKTGVEPNEIDGGKTDNVKDSQSGSQANTDSSQNPQVQSQGGSGQVEADSGVVAMLYDVLQNILTDVILVLSEDDTDIASTIHVESSDENAADEASSSSMTEDRANVENLSSSERKSSSSPPLSLKYLNEHCERRRLRILILTLDEVLEDTELDCCARLRQVALSHGLIRLAGIIDEYSAG